MTAFLAARFGRKNYLTFSILLFIAASFCAAPPIRWSSL